MRDRIGGILPGLEPAVEPHIVLDRRVALYTSAECWRGAAISYVHIANGLIRHGFLVHVVALEPHVAEEMTAAGLDVTLLRRGRGESARLRRFLRCFGADLVLVDRAHDLRVATLATLGTKVRVVNRYNLCRATPPTDALVRLGYRATVSEVVFLSQTARDRVLEEAPFMRRARVSMIHEGIDSQMFRPDERAAARFRRRYGFGDRRFLLAVGALFAEKRYQFLFQCLRSLGSPPPLLILGEGPDEHLLRRQADDARLAVRFAGRLPRADLVGAYNAALGLVHAGDRETFGLAVLEAMACGRPLVAAAGGALPEVVGPSGECGLLASPSSVEDFTAAIRAMIAGGDEWNARAVRARRRASTMFSVRQMEDAYAAAMTRQLRA